MSASFDVFANAFATESCRRAPPATTAIGRPIASRSAFAPASTCSSGSATTISLDAIAGRQGRDAQLEDRPAADVEELLGPIGAEAHAPAACGDNGGNVHVRNEDCTSEGGHEARLSDGGV